MWFAAPRCIGIGVWGVALTLGCAAPEAPPGEPWFDLVANAPTAIREGEPVVEEAGGVIVLPPGAALSYSFFLRSGTSLRLDGLVLPDEMRLEVTIEVDGDRPRRAARFQRLMDENDWTRSELARQLGISRAWVTKVLGRA